MFIQSTQHLASIVDDIHSNLVDFNPHIKLRDVRLAYAKAHSFETYEDFERRLPYFPRSHISCEFNRILNELMGSTFDVFCSSMPIDNIQRISLSYPIWSCSDAKIAFDVKRDLGRVSRPFLRYFLNSSDYISEPEPNSRGDLTFYIPTDYINEKEFDELIDLISPLLKDVNKIGRDGREGLLDEREVNAVREIRRLISRYSDDLPGRKVLTPARFYSQRLELEFNDDSFDDEIYLDGVPILNSQSSDRDVRALVGREVAANAYCPCPIDIYYYFTEMIATTAGIDMHSIREQGPGYGN
ncbi:hypothetical protein [Microbulbifer aggregans]|uniref:hypothetical protein n=1 Tax=Microbulbifer aggregans TaxID=1769779 RepID=UPI001CFCD618|nr:hypothetical protein [Microbulbifer aggregans]